MTRYNPALTILAVSDDAELLGNAALVLQAIGHRVICTRNVEHAVVWAASCQPDVCLVDARSDCNSMPLREIESTAALHHLKIVLWMEGGDDVPRLSSASIVDIVEPDAWGELLARLRTMARLKEFESRLADDCGLELLTHLPTLTRFQAAAVESWRREQVAAALHVRLDIAATEAILGQEAAQRIALASARNLQPLTPPPLALTSAAPGEFQILLSHDADPHEVADVLLQRFAQTMISIRGTEFPLTCSIGIALSGDCETLEQVLEAAAAASQFAVQRGGNAAIDEEQHDALTEQWRQLSASNSLFDKTTAEQLMTPFPFAVQLDESLHAAAEFLAHSHFDYLPVLDADDQYAGLLSRHELKEEAGNVSDCLDDVPATPKDLKFPEVLSRLGDSSVLVVVDDGKPLGMITLQQLAVLDQLHTPASCVAEDCGTSRLVVAAG